MYQIGDAHEIDFSFTSLKYLCINFSTREIDLLEVITILILFAQ